MYSPGLCWLGADGTHRASGGGSGGPGAGGWWAASPEAWSSSGSPCLAELCQGDVGSSLRAGGALVSFPSLGSRSAPMENGNGDLLLISFLPHSSFLSSYPRLKVGRSQRLGNPQLTLSHPRPPQPRFVGKSLGLRADPVTHGGGARLGQCPPGGAAPSIPVLGLLPRSPGLSSPGHQADLLWTPIPGEQVQGTEAGSGQLCCCQPCALGQWPSLPGAQLSNL